MGRAVPVGEVSVRSPGPATAWSRMRHPLVAEEEEVTPLTRVLVVADSGNGLSSELDLTWHFINPELTVHLHREPLGDWVCGAGLATTVLHDVDGCAPGRRC